MLVVDRKTGAFVRIASFRDFPSYVHPGDCLVLNDSRVFPSRLFGHREHGAGGRVEVFLTRQTSSDGLTWEALVRPGEKDAHRRARHHSATSSPSRSSAAASSASGPYVCNRKGDLFAVLDRVGHVPLPPYIRRADTNADRERYQTVFARERGSVAAPTAGLHFTPEILDRCQAAGAAIARVTLHVGLGTFQPIHDDLIEKVHLHSERFIVPRETMSAMDSASRVIAVGTTSVRAIESDPARPETDLFIYPGFLFRRTGAMLTNFHLPKSSLLVLVCAFAGTELMLSAYRHAVEARYRFFSYGDCMLIL